MIIPAKTDKRVKRMCSKPSDHRRALHNPNLDANKGYLYATNGHAIARLKVKTNEADTSGQISQDSIAAALALQKAMHRKDAHVIANGSLQIPDGPIFNRPEETYPDVTSIFQSIEGEPVYSINFDSKLLADLSAALCDANVAGKVKLEFFGQENHAIKVSNGTENIGILMPCRPNK